MGGPGGPGRNPGGGIPAGGMPGRNPGGGMPGRNPGGGAPGGRMAGPEENCGRMCAAAGPPTPVTGPWSPGAAAPSAPVKATVSRIIIIRVSG